MTIIILIIFSFSIYITSCISYWYLLITYQTIVNIEYRVTFLNLVIMMLPIINGIYCLILYLEIKEKIRL